MHTINSDGYAVNCPENNLYLVGLMIRQLEAQGYEIRVKTGGSYKDVTNRGCNFRFKSVSGLSAYMGMG